MIIRFTTYSQIDTTGIVGKWIECYGDKLDSNKICDSTPSPMTYEFREDGTCSFFDEGEGYIIMGKKYKYSDGTWSYNGKTLIINGTVDQNGMKFPDQKFNVKWLNPTLFYDIGKESGEDSPLFYIYFKKRK